MNSFIHVNGVCVPAGKGRYRHYINQTIKYCIVMKLFFAILLININVSVAAYSQRIDLNVKNQSFRDVITSIREQSGYYFFFPTEMLKQAKPVTVTLNQASIEETLQKICEGQPFIYTIKDKAILLNRRNENLDSLISKEKKKADIRGTITDTEGRPLAGATVMIVGYPSLGASTNDHGEFVINNVPESGKLLVRMIGFGSKEVSYGQISIMHIILNQIDTDMDEIQIIGYGTVSKRLNTGNVGTLRSPEIERQNINNPILALQGRMPGVEITQVNGIAGGAVKINIRGVNSLRQGTDPLFVVDGIPYNSNHFNTPGFGGLLSGVAGAGGGNANQNLGPNPLSLINPQDIESIDVLKDADATAIYGSRGANGVILITTKKGKMGPTKVDINMQQGYGEISRKAKLMNTQQYLDMRQRAFANDNVEPTSGNAPDLKVWDQNSYTDWQDFLIGGRADYTNVQANVSGGNENTQFLIGSNYHRETTVFPGDWSDRKAGLHFNIDNVSTNKRFKILLSGSFLNDKNQLPLVDFTRYITLAPNAPSLTNPDGTLNWEEFNDNPLNYKDIRYAAKTENLLGNGVLSYIILPGLELKTSLGYNNISLDEKTSNPIRANNPADGVTTGSGQFNTNNLRSWIIEPQLNYNIIVAKGRLGILIGGSIQRRSIEGQVITAGGYTDDGLLGSLAGAAEIGKGESIFEQYKYASGFARINYNWRDKYIMNLTGRRDGSSRFGPGRQYGNFAAIGAGWIFSSEDFFSKLLPIISYGKLRVSYGTSGNEPSSNYAFLELYNLSNDFPYAGGLGIYPKNLPAPDYRWEINKKLETGLELGFINDRITFSASYYRNRSSNQLVDYPYASIVGFTSITANLPATIENSGVEFTLSTVNLASNAFEWRTGFNISASRNKLVNFPYLETSSYRNAYVVGQPVSLTKVYRSAGIDQTTGRYLFYNGDNKPVLTPANPADRTGIVNLIPKFYGGLMNSFTYKNLRIDLDFQFVKQRGRNYIYANLANPGRFNSFSKLGNQPVEVLNELNSGNTSLQKFSQSSAVLSSYEFAKNSDLAYTDASFVRLKNLSISFSLSQKLSQRLSLQKVRLFLQAQNLMTFTNYKGADPETQTIFALPTLRVITCGLQVTL